MLAEIVPHERQIKFQQTEFYAFVHFTVNTFTDREWHSRMTEHTVEYSPFQRDIVREVSDACRKCGIKFGVYLSPWDRHSPLYGSFEKIYENTVIGYKRIIRLDNTRTDCLRINITDSRTAPTLAFIGIYKGE